MSNLPSKAEKIIDDQSDIYHHLLMSLIVLM